MSYHKLIIGGVETVETDVPYEQMFTGSRTHFSWAPFQFKDRLSGVGIPTLMSYFQHGNPFTVRRYLYIEKFGLAYTGTRHTTESFFSHSFLPAIMPTTSLSV